MPDGWVAWPAGAMLCAALLIHGTVVDAQPFPTAPMVVAARLVAFPVSEPAEREFVEAMRREWRASAPPSLPGWGRALRLVEHRAGRRWRSPLPTILLVPDDGAGFDCPHGRCLGRFEAARFVRQGTPGDSVVVFGVILLAESAMLREAVWLHELTHALLAQHGMIDASLRHDPRYFPPIEALAHR